MRLALALLLAAGCRHGSHGEIDPELDLGIEEAECCLGPKRWESADGGWQSWRTESFRLEPGKFDKFAVALTSGLHYRFEACGQEGVRDLDLILYDAKGQILARDDSTGREPILTWEEPESTTRHLVVYLRETEGGGSAGISYGWASLTGEAR